MFFILLVSFPILMTAQIKSVNVKKNQAPRQTTNIKAQQGVLPSNQVQNKIPFFVIKSVEVLRIETAHLASLLTPTSPQPQSSPSSFPNAGNSKYTIGDGVVLDVLSPFDPVTGSIIQLSNVIWTKEIVSDIKSNIAPTLELSINHSESETPIRAVFKDISTTPHTYLLTIGMHTLHGVSVLKDQTKITIRNETISAQVFENSALIYNEATSEIRILFIGYGYYSPVDLISSGSFPLIVEVKFDLGFYSLDFHHIQLVQLD